MRPDLEELEITRGELKKLTGVDVEGDGCVWLVFIFLVFVAIQLLLINIGYFIQIPPLLSTVLGFAMFSLFLWGIVSAYKQTQGSLNNLLKQVERYNAVVKVIDVSDQLEEAGNLIELRSNREKVVELLKIVRGRLVKSLKTERIIRENKNLVENSELFLAQFTDLESVDATDVSSRDGKLVNEVLQISANVQSEMRKLQKRS
ncbi:hypothetical protein [Microseira sp. BLCC-F43]|jgi:hypothetical protein|uniref:hypothetical protein n=1 Tax=Microseira sp. BLCC-F43 TaxID=3153602 RepID=UPI0035BB43AC